MIGYRIKKLATLGNRRKEENTQTKREFDFSEFSSMVCGELIEIKSYGKNLENYQFSEETYTTRIGYRCAEA